MSEFQKRLLPRLVLDTASCVELAYNDLDPDLRLETRKSVTSLRKMDVTDVESAIAALRTFAGHMREVETSLNAAGRPHAMGKVRRVRERVEHAASSCGF